MFPTLKLAIINYGVHYLFLYEKRSKKPRVIVAFSFDQNSGLIMYGYSVRLRPTDPYYESTACDVASSRMLINGIYIQANPNEKVTKTIVKHLALSKDKEARKWFPLRTKWIACKQLRKF